MQGGLEWQGQPLGCGQNGCRTNVWRMVSGMQGCRTSVRCVFSGQQGCRTSVRAAEQVRGVCFGHRAAEQVCAQGHARLSGML
eukprot:6998410-Alexandrium_andersonii.AAC.1